MQYLNKEKLQEEINYIEVYQKKLNTVKYKDLSRGELSKLISFLVTLEKGYKIRTSNNFISREEILKKTNNDDVFVNQIDFKGYNYVLSDGGMFRAVTKKSIQDQMGEVKNSLKRRLKGKKY